MKPASILVVEDSTITRRMFRAALASQGWEIREASSGREALERLAEGLPDLVLVDLILPDMDGREVLKAVRALPGGDEVPVVAMSGFLSRLEQARADAVGFVECLFKPVEFERLIEIVHAHRRPSDAGPRDTRRRVLLVNDEQLQLELMRLQFEQAGFSTWTEESAQAALARALAEVPDAVVSDVLMPDLDGFQLCLALRREPRLAHVPVILHSVAFTEEADQTLARSVGASALVRDQDDVGGVIAALEAAWSGEPPIPTVEIPLPSNEYVHRLIRQMERQAGRNAQLAGRLALYEASMGVLARMEEASRRTDSVDDLVAELLHHALDAAGISLGLMYLRDATGSCVLRARQGFTDEDGDLASFFGSPALLGAALLARRPLHVPAGLHPDAVEDGLLARAGARALVLVPLVLGAQELGVLVLAAARRRMSDEWMPFIETLGLQVAQTITLAQAVQQTARDQARLAASEGMMRQITENIHEVFYMSDRGLDQILYVSPAYEKIWGRSTASLIAEPLSWTAAIHPEDREQVLLQTLSRQRSGEPFDHTYRILRPDGSMRWIRDHGFPVRDASGEVTRFAGTARDITDQKLAEDQLVSTQEQLRRAQKMEAVGRLAGGVAHDFNNLLTVLQGYADLMLDDLESHDPLREQLNVMRKAMTRAAGLTRQLLVFSRHERVAPQVLEVNGVLAELENMLHRLIGEDLELTVELVPGIGRARVDRGYLEQVVVNLCVNARDAMPHGGTLRIATGWVGEVPPGAVGGVATPGPHVRLTVTDDGTGMTDEVVSHLFEPFFTTKEAGKGTGLGLSTVYGIVNGAGGRIGVDTRPGHGTTFSVYLPSVIDPPTVLQTTERAAPGTSVDETILLVEDDELIRELSQRVLQRAGYQVLACANGGEALLRLEQHPGPIDLVITDVVMPLMSGPELIARLEKLRPGLRVIFCSGYTSGSLTQADLARESGRAFLEKPFASRELLAKVREVLEDGTGRGG